MQFFLPLAYTDSFAKRMQVVWIHETRQDGLSVPSLCCKERFLVRTLSENIIAHEEVAFNAARFCILPVLSKEESVR